MRICCFCLRCNLNILSIDINWISVWRSVKQTVFKTPRGLWETVMIDDCDLMTLTTSWLFAHHTSHFYCQLIMKISVSCICIRHHVWKIFQCFSHCLRGDFWNIFYAALVCTKRDILPIKAHKRLQHSYTQHFSLKRSNLSVETRKWSSERYKEMVVKDSFGATLLL